MLKQQAFNTRLSNVASAVLNPGKPELKIVNSNSDSSLLRRMTPKVLADAKNFASVVH